MSIIACSVDGCEKSKVSRGLCRSHYGKAQYAGTLDSHPLQVDSKPSECSVGECDGASVARGWCAKHYSRWRKTGSLETTRFNKKTCTVGSCDKPHKSRGFCSMHYRRWSLSGDVGSDVPTFLPRPVVDGMRECKDCKANLPEGSFTRHTRTGRLHPQCKNCRSLRAEKFRRDNPDYWKHWQANNTGKVRDIANRRRAKRLSAPNEKIDRAVVFERDNYTCKICLDPIDMDLKWPHRFSPTLDHIIPINKGGAHLYENLQAAHFTCNVSKGDRLPQ